LKAIVQSRYGSADVLSLADVDKPSVGDGEILIEIRAAGVDPGVWHLMTGLPLVMRVMGFGFRAPKNPVRGRDLAGRVIAVGTNVTQFEPGDSVFGTADGSFAEFACAREDTLAPMPANISFEEAAAIPTSACTALKALRDAGHVQSGQRVLVIGAGGGIGTFAVQLAKAFGAHVTGVCSTSKVELVRGLGADAVVDYTQNDFVDGGTSYDLILDTAGNRPLSQLRPALTRKGTLVIIGGEGSGRWLGGIDRPLRAVLLSPFVSQTIKGLVAVAKADDLQLLKELVEAGKVKPVVERTYELTEAPDAIRELERGHTRGKLVVKL
jgi:NADPH:quinone reductase-like Zn-dependent oxidoreductase